MPLKGAGEEAKQTNEIKMAIPLLERIDIQGKDISADALLTQRDLARYLVEDRHATQGKQALLERIRAVRERYHPTISDADIEDWKNVRRP